MGIWLKRSNKDKESGQFAQDILDMKRGCPDRNEDVKPDDFFMD